MTVFEVTSKSGKAVRLTEIQWAHIKIKHPELDSQSSKIIDTLKAPDFVCYSPDEENYEYYKYFTATPVTEKYLLIIVKHFNGAGFVITAFFVSKIRKAFKEAVDGKENFYKL